MTRLHKTLPGGCIVCLVHSIWSLHVFSAGSLVMVLRAAIVSVTNKDVTVRGVNTDITLYTKYKIEIKPTISVCNS